MKVTLIAFLLLMQSAFATDCTPVNLVTEANSPFQKIPVYDQDGIGICYAYVAAQLLDYEIVKSGKERSVHPLWAALKYSESKKKDNLSSGITYYTLQEIIKSGNCQYDKISDAIGVWAKKANVREAEIMNLIEKFAPKLKELYADKESATETVSTEELDAVILEALEEHKPYCSAGATWDQLMPELRSLSVMGSRQMLAGLVLPVCNGVLPKPKVNPPKYFTTEVDSAWSPEMQKKLDKKAPISISYCSKVLYEPEYDGIERKTATTASVNAEDCGGHESLIVGKKKIGESCHFLLRNSWGTGFGSSTEKWKCLCKNRATGEMVDDCEASTHNTGEYVVEGCWISSESLGKNIFGVTSLEKTPPKTPAKPKSKPAPAKKK